MSSYKNKLSGWGSLAVLLLGVSPVMAQIESGSGLIRITDKVAANNSAPISAASQTRTISQGTSIQGQCQSGNCQTGQCQNCEYSNSQCPNCYGHGQWMMGPHMGALCYGCTRSPGTGYIPPGKIPVKRQAVGYTQWYPSYWSGMGPGNYVPFNPAVGVPTDTTQLGYYYNHVPTWQPKPNMIPGIPNPDSWHIRRCNNEACYGNNHGNHHGNHHAAHCPQCQAHGSTTMGQGTNLTPVPEHINQPSHTMEKNNQPANQMQAPKIEEAPEPMAYFPDLGTLPESRTELISFPQLEAVEEVDAEE